MLLDIAPSISPSDLLMIFSDFVIVSVGNCDTCWGRGFKASTGYHRKGMLGREERSLRLVVAGEASALLAAMKRSGRWGGSKMVGELGQGMTQPIMADVSSPSRRR